MERESEGGVQLILQYHGIVMSISFLLFTATAIAAARYGKGKAWRDDAHLYFQLVSHVCSILGTIIPFCFFIDYNSNFQHFPSYHSYFGIVTIVLSTFVVPMLGVPDDNISRKEKKLSLFRHRLLGRLTFLVSLITIYLGYQRLSIFPYEYYYMSLLIIFILFVFLEIRFQLNKRKQRLKNQ